MNTTDLFLASVLSLWFVVDHIDKSDPRRFRFVFTAEEEDFNNLVTAYRKGQVQVDPQELFRKYKDLRDRMHD